MSPHKTGNPICADIAGIAQLDLLSDGRLHTHRACLDAGVEALITGQFASAEAAVDRSRAALADLVKSGQVTRDGDMVRMFASAIERWRGQRALPPVDDVNIFGGIIEGEGWLYAPLHYRDIIFFRTTGDVRIAEMRAALTHDDNVRAVTSNGEGLIQVIADDHVRAQAAIVAFCNSRNVSTHNLRVTSRARRREASDLPNDFYLELLRHYSERVAPNVIAKRTVFANARQPSENEDLRQQAVLWTIMAIERFDDQLGVPFLAYLHTQINRHLNDLGRTSWGRTAVDAERAHHAAVEDFTSVHGREPSDRELAAWADIPLDVVLERRGLIDQINGARRPDTVDPETPVYTGETVDARIIDAETETDLSRYVTEIGASGPGGHVVWYALYQLTWGTGSAQKIADECGVDPAELDSALQRAHAWLRDNLTEAEIPA